MTFVMKKFAQALRQGRSRTMGRRSVSCEILECRQLLSTGMQPGELVRVMPAFASRGWESRWLDMASTRESTGAQTQVVTNPAGAGLGPNLEFGSGSAQFPAASAGGAGPIAMATTSSMRILPGGGEFVLADAPTQIASGESTGSIAGSAVTSSSVSSLPGGLNVGYGGGQGLVVSSAINGAPVTQSSTGVAQGAIEVGPGGAPVQMVNDGSSGTAAGSSVTSAPSLIAFPGGPNVGYGGGQALFVSTANNGAPVTEFSTGVAQGAIEVGPGGAPMEIVSGGIAGSTPGSAVATSSTGASPELVEAGAGGAPIQMVSGNGSQSGTTSSSA